MGHSHLRLPAVVLAVFALAALAVAATASAAPGQSQTVHFNSIVDQLGTPVAPTTNVSNCPAAVLNDFADINATGNGVFHENVSKTGDWFTTTFTGTATVAFYPPADAVFDQNGNLVSLTGTPDMTVTGHLTQWFGGADNNQNALFHGTVNFQGTVVGSGAPIGFHNVVHGAWLPGADPNGPPSFFSNVASC